MVSKGVRSTVRMDDDGELPCVAALLPASLAPAATGDPVLINEVLASHTGTDDTEYIELYGDPGYSLTGLSLIVVEGDVRSAGTIDRRIDFLPFQTMGDNGFYLVGNCGGLPLRYGVTPDDAIGTDSFENSSLTVALVETTRFPAAWSPVPRWFSTPSP